MTDFGRRAGTGDMLKSVYDTNDDGVVDQAPAHKATHQDAGSDEIILTDLTGKSLYVDRGEVSAPDFSVSDFTTDDGYHDLDLSSIVPANAKQVHVSVWLYDNLTSMYLILLKQGRTDLNNALAHFIAVANIATVMDGFVPCDENRIITYRASNTSFTTIDFTVRGWII